jgi:hypothetical protein
MILDYQLFWDMNSLQIKSITPSYNYVTQYNLIVLN